MNMDLRESETRNLSDPAALHIITSCTKVILASDWLKPFVRNCKAGDTMQDKRLPVNVDITADKIRGIPKRGVGQALTLPKLWLATTGPFFITLKYDWLWVQWEAEPSIKPVSEYRMFSAADTEHCCFLVVKN